MDNDQPLDADFEVTDEELLHELEEEKVEMNDDLTNVVIVDNVPVVGQKKYAKLLQVLKKLLGKYGEIVKPNGVFLPLSEDDAPKTLGYCFVEYTTPEHAKNAVRMGDNYRMDKKHTLRINLYRDIEKFSSLPTELEIKHEDYEAKDNTLGWLTDGRSQYFLRHDQETMIYWNDSLYANENGRHLNNGGEEHKEKGKMWTELVCEWSTQGSYLATFHAQGIVLWGGDGFQRQGKFKHEGVRLIDFSPNEKYLVTCNAREPTRPGDPECIIVWDVRSGKKLRGFSGGKKARWPVFKWSQDDKFLARVTESKGKDAIAVYETPTMGLLDKTSIKVPQVAEVAWSPTNNILSFWVPERGNIPAKVSLVQMPSRKVIREKHLYSVTDLQMIWHPDGDYLAVQMVRHKTKKTRATNVEIFRMRQKNIPVETLEIDDQAIAFAWEPKGSRFAMIHNDSRLTHVSFYQLQKKKMKKLGTLEDRPVNALFWSPLGTYVVLASLGTNTGTLECVNAVTMHTLAEREHFMCRDAEWDPTGRFLMSSVSQALDSTNMREKMENGYKIWTLDGKDKGVFVCTTTCSFDKLYQARWRPRPKFLLNKQEQRNLQATLREKYWRKFELEDEEIRRDQLGDAEKKRLEAADAWKAYRRERLAEYRQEAKERIALRHGLLSDDEEDYTETEEEIETEIEVKEEILGPVTTSDD